MSFQVTEMAFSSYSVSITRASMCLDVTSACASCPATLSLTSAHISQLVTWCSAQSLLTTACTVFHASSVQVERFTMAFGLHGHWQDRSFTALSCHTQHVSLVATSIRVSLCSEPSSSHMLTFCCSAYVRLAEAVILCCPGLCRQRCAMLERQR